MFNFHGTGSSPKQIAELNELETLAEQHKFIVVAPKAEYSYEAGGRQTWNVEQLDSPYDDVAFIKGLIAHLAQHYPIDTARIYATGFSGGARMSSRLACDLADCAFLRSFSLFRQLFLIRFQTTDLRMERGLLIYRIGCFSREIIQRKTVALSTRRNKTS